VMDETIPSLMKISSGTDDEGHQQRSKKCPRIIFYKTMRYVNQGKG
jgi:hypothetical protein